MAIVFSLYLEKRIPVTRLKQRIAEITGVPLTEYGTFHDPVSGLLIGARAGDKELGDMTEEDYGFRAGTIIWFRQGKREYARNDRIMLGVVARLLKEVPGRAVLEFDEDPSTVLIRREDTLIIDPAWKDKPGMEYLMQGDFKYKLEKLPRL